MEAFSLLKYWRGGGGGGGGGIGEVTLGSKSTATIITTVDSSTTTEAEDEEILKDNTAAENDNDDGPFFDLEFSLDDDEEDDDEKKSTRSDSDEDEDGDEDEDEREFDFTLSSESTHDCTDSTLTPSEGLFFKGKLVPVDGGQTVDCDVTSTKPQPPPQFSLLKSATKLRVFMLGLKKSKSNNAESVPTAKKLFTVKFKVEEVPIVSLFTRDNSSRSASSKTTTTTTTAASKPSLENETTSVSEEKRFSKEVMQKYLKKVKPLYVKVSRRYGEKLRLAGQVSVEASSPAKPESPAAAEELEAPVATVVSGKSGVGGVLNLPAGLRVVCKHLGKSRSASSAVVAAAPAPGTTTTVAAAGSRRRDDSLIQQQDGIQSAILHCKRSFNATRDSESTLLSRCASDPSNEKKCLDLSRKSSDGV